MLKSAIISPQSWSLFCKLFLSDNMHNHTFKFNFSCPTDHVSINNFKVLTGFQLTGASFTSSPGTADEASSITVFSSPPSSPREGRLPLADLGHLSLPNPVDTVSALFHTG